MPGCGEVHRETASGREDQVTESSQPGPLGNKVTRDRGTVGPALQREAAPGSEDSHTHLRSRYFPPTRKAFPSLPPHDPIVFLGTLPMAEWPPTCLLAARQATAIGKQGSKLAG